MPTEQDPDKDTTLDSMVSVSLDLLSQRELADGVFINPESCQFIKETISTMKQHIDND